MIDLVTLAAWLRGLHLAATLSLLGTAGFLAWILPSCSDMPKALRGLLARLRWVSGLIALLAGAAWFVLQASLIADANTLSQALAAMPVVAADTRFGNILLARLGLLLIATLLGLPSRTGRSLTWRNSAILLVTATALSLQGMIGHVGATAGLIGNGLVISEALHLLAAGFWLGALPPLFISLWLLPQAQAAAVCEGFSPIGLGCVLMLAGTGLRPGGGADRQPAGPVGHRLWAHRAAENRIVPDGARDGGRQPALADRPFGGRRQGGTPDHAAVGRRRDNGWRCDRPRRWLSRLDHAGCPRHAGLALPLAVQPGNGQPGP